MKGIEMVGPNLRGAGERRQGRVRRIEEKRGEETIRSGRTAIGSRWVEMNDEVVEERT